MTTAASEATAGIGHNNPPVKTLPEVLADTYGLEIEKVEPLAARATALPQVLTADKIDDAADIAGEARDLAKALDQLREVEKRPHLQAGRDVDGYFNPTIQRLERMSKILLDRITQHRRAVQAEENRKRAEQDRIQREAAEKARQDAEAAQRAGRTDDALEELKDAAIFEQRAEQIATAPSVAPDFKGITDSGTSIGTRKSWTFEITDFETLDLNKLRPFMKREDVEKALRAHVRIHKGTMAIGGVRFFEDEAATVRR